MPRLLIENGRLIDPSQELDRVGNLLIEDGRIAAYDVSPHGDEQRIDAAGRIVAPGLIDLHVQLREPGAEEDETVATGSAAALAGGFTSIVCLPNTAPPIDTPAGVQYVRQRANRAAGCNVFVLASVSKERAGEELSEIGALVEAGAVGFTDAPRPIHNAELLRRAFQYSSMFDKPVFNHPEMLELSRGGVMHEGLVSLVLGLPGMPAEAEDVMTARDLRLAEATGGRLHLMNISTSGSVDLIRRAKDRGVAVTAEICSQHFTLTDESMRTFDPNCKVIPPFRSEDHIAACIQGLRDGVIDVICSGHAPRALEKKMQELDQAPYGMINLETALALAITRLIYVEGFSWSQLLATMTCNPARVLRLEKGTLQIGADADVTIINPDREWEVQPPYISKSANTPLRGRRLRGKAEHVVVGGEVKYSDRQHSLK
ncbi:dihydroorotase [Lignipirellula cremea]|uniref:Dihydroorotase n=1 Tax=Lignipirellula cremea TaxID=2528010 RepID=A0A518DLI1_9BACT|nr:dihydroorotase [Lignipirellula cremea]QDU92697.1 Dihydroorotase [Lignipirellula cremea]